MKWRLIPFIALAFGGTALSFSQPLERSTALAREALKMIRVEHRAIEAERQLEGPEAKAVELFHEALAVDPDCLARFVQHEPAECQEVLQRFLKASQALPAAVDEGDAASAILKVLGETREFQQADNPMMVGYQAAYLLNMEELRDATTMQQLIAFLAALDSPLTFKDLGLDGLSKDRLSALAERAARIAQGDRFYKTQPYNFYLTLVRLDRWGARDKGQRNGLAVAAEMIAEEPEFFFGITEGLKALPPMTVVFFGDSDTDAIHWSSSAHYPEIVAGVFQRLNPAVKVINAGVGGDDTGEGLERMQQDVIAHRPGICFIMFGGNDSNTHGGSKPAVALAEFIRNLADMVHQLRSIGCTPVLMSTHQAPPTGEDSLDDVILLRYIQATEQLAGILAVDLLRPREILDGPDRLSMYAMDNIHLSERGQKVLARFVLECLASKGLEASDTD